MSADAESGPLNQSKSDKGKGIAAHTRHVSIDENLHPAGRLRASSSPFTASPLPGESKSSENIFSHQPSQSYSSTKANNHPPSTPVEAPSSTSAKVHKEGESSNARLEEENEAVHVKEKPRINHHRRLSSKSHASPRQSSNHLEHPVQNPEDPARSMTSWRLFLISHFTINTDIA